MSHIRVKTKYNTEGSYGSIDEVTIYAHHNLSCDYVDFYDEDGSHILTVPDTINNNILDAINRLYNTTWDYKGITTENVESMSKEDILKIKH